MPVPSKSSSWYATCRSTPSSIVGGPALKLCTTRPEEDPPGFPSLLTDLPPSPSLLSASKFIVIVAAVDTLAVRGADPLRLRKLSRS
jgi:hypothetical protein